MAQSIKKRLQALVARKDKVVGRVYACGTSTDRFTDCLEKAPEALRAEYNTLRSACLELEGAAVSQGKAWRNSIGSLTFYR